MMPAMQADRRPAIWPWLVMPLIALTAFYCLDRLRREAGDQEEDLIAPAMVVQPQAERAVAEGHGRAAGAVDTDTAALETDDADSQDAGSGGGDVPPYSSARGAETPTQPPTR